jgi:hypothetical protein
MKKFTHPLLLLIARVAGGPRVKDPVIPSLGLFLAS